jgi:non-specific serine/threonine protein kinase
MVWFDRLELEHDNLRAALGWALKREAVEDALRLSGALAYFWETRGYLSEGRRWLETILDLPSTQEGRRFTIYDLNSPGVDSSFSPQPSDFAAARAKALVGAGWLASRQGDYAAAIRHGQASLALYRDLGRPPAPAASLLLLSGSALAQGDYAMAQAWHVEGLALYRELGDRAGISWFLSNMGLAHMFQGDYAQAVALCAEGLAIRRELGNARHIAIALNHLAFAILLAGDIKQADRLFAELLVRQQQLGDRWFIQFALIGAASVAGARGQGDRAARLFGAADALRDALGVPVPPSSQPTINQLVAVARRLLDPAAFDAAWAAGRALTAAQAIEYAFLAANE